MKIIRTASFNKLSKKKEWDPNPWAVCHTTVDKDEDPDKYERCVQEVKNKQKTKPAKMPKNNRGQWDAHGDFSNRIKDEFSGVSDKKKNDAMDDKWKQLMNKKRQPAYAKSKKKKKEPDAVLTSKMVKPFKR